MVPRTFVKIARPNLTLEWEAVKNIGHDYWEKLKTLCLHRINLCVRPGASLSTFIGFELPLIFYG